MLKILMTTVLKKNKENVMKKTKFSNIKLNNIFEAIIKDDDFVITGHVGVDADCVTSMLALYFLLKKYNKNVEMMSADIRPRSVANIPHVDKVNFLEDESDFDKAMLENKTLIVVDAGEMRRIGYISQYTNLCKTVYFIDHHKNKLDNRANALKDVGKYYIDERAAATAQIIAKMLFTKNEVSREIATLLYAGMIADTGGFIFTNTTSDTLLIASQLMRVGVDLDKIIAIIKRRYNENDIKAYKHVLNSIIVCENKKIAYLYSEDKIEGVAIKDLSISLVETTMQVDGVEMGFIIRSEGDKFRVSLRSRCEKDVQPIAVKYGGGGHLKASGFEVSTSDYTKESLIESLYADLNGMYN